MNYIRRLMLVFVLIGQVLYPTQAYAYIPPPLLYAGVASVTAHAGLLLIEFGSLSFGGAPAGGGGTSGGGASSAGGGGTSGGRPTHPGFGPGGAGAGGVPVNLTPDTTYVPAGWGPKPDAAAGAGGSGSGAGGTSGSSGARPGRPIPYPPEVAAKKGTCYYSDGTANPPTCQQQCALRGYKSGPDPSDCYYEGSIAASIPHFIKDACPKGYRQEGATCKLTNYRDVEKPPKTPCEPVRINGKFQLDPNNPECAKHNNTLPEANGCQSEISAGVYQLHCVGSDVNVYPNGIEVIGPDGTARLPFSSGASGGGGPAGGGGPPIIEVPADKPMKFPGPILPVTVDEITNYSCDSQGLCNPTGSASGGSSASGSTGGGGSSPGSSGGGSSTGSSSAGGGGGGSSGGGSAGSGPGSGGANFPGSGGSGSSGTPGGAGGTGSSGTPGGTGGTGSSGTPGGSGGTDAPGGTGGTGGSGSSGTPGGTGGTGSSGTPGGTGGTDATGGTGGAGGTPGAGGSGGTPGAGAGGTPGSGSGATPGAGSGSGSAPSGDGWLGAIVSKFDAVIGAIGGIGESVKSMPDKIAESIGSAFGLSGVDSNADISIPTVSAGDKYDRHDFELMRSCPAPLVLNLSLAGQQVFTFQYVCEFAATLRPLVLASAYLSAFYIVFVYRED